MPVIKDYIYMMVSNDKYQLPICVAEQNVKKTSAPKKKIDHGRIVALYTANPPRSIEWIADDCKCSQQTVINHLKQEGIYKTLQERRDGKQEEEE